MANLLSLEFRAKIAIDQSKKFSPHDARQRKAKTSLGRTYIASLAHTMQNAGASSTLYGFLRSSLKS